MMYIMYNIHDARYISHGLHLKLPEPNADSVGLSEPKDKQQIWLTFGFSCNSTKTRHQLIASENRVVIKSGGGERSGSINFSSEY